MGHFELLLKRTPEAVGVYMIYQGSDLLRNDGLLYGILGGTCIGTGIAVIFLTSIWYLYQQILKFRGDIEKELRTEFNKSLKEWQNRDRKQHDQQTKLLMDIYKNNSLMSNETTMVRSMNPDIDFDKSSDL